MQEEKGMTERDGWIASPAQCEFGQALELVTDREACHAADHGVTKSDTTG